MDQRYTRREVGRILGVEPSRLRYWERLRLVRPRARWGERFYSFGDLVASRTLQRLTDNHIPARRVRRAVRLIEQQFGEPDVRCRNCASSSRAAMCWSFRPAPRALSARSSNSGSFSFEASARPSKLHAMAGPTPEELFQSALDCESNPDMLPQAVERYRQVLDLTPGWVDAHINLGVALYQLGRAEEARAEFLSAVRPRSAERYLALQPRLRARGAG